VANFDAAIKMMILQKNIFLIIGSVALLCLFSKCKKYPENILLLKNPKKVIAKAGTVHNSERPTGPSWILTNYIINGVDSTNSDFFKVYREEGIKIYLDKTDKEESQWCSCIDIMQTAWSFFDKKKVVMFAGKVSTNSSNPNYLNQRNVFVEPGLRWTIKKLDKNNLWLTADNNGNAYEIRFK
jgi:hypothetical protein